MNAGVNDFIKRAATENAVTPCVLDLTIVEADVMRVAAKMDARKNPLTIERQIIENHVAKLSPLPENNHITPIRRCQGHGLAGKPGNGGGMLPGSAVGNRANGRSDRFGIGATSEVEGIAGREHTEAFLNGAKRLKPGAGVGVRAVGGGVVGGGGGRPWGPEATEHKPGENHCG